MTAESPRWKKTERRHALRYGPVVGGRVGYIAYIHVYIHTYKRASIPLHQNHTTPPHHTLLFAGTVTAATAVVVEGSRARPRHWRVIIPFNSSRLIARIVCACSTEGERGERWKKSKERQGGSVGWGDLAPRPQSVCLGTLAAVGEKGGCCLPGVGPCRALSVAN